MGRQELENSHGQNEEDQENGLDHAQQDAALPQQPTLTEVMATQTRLLQQLVKATVHNKETPKEGLRNRIESFIKLKAPIFDHSDDPL